MMLNRCEKILKCNAKRKRHLQHTKGKQKSKKSADDDDNEVDMFFDDDEDEGDEG